MSISMNQLNVSRWPDVVVGLKRRYWWNAVWFNRKDTG